MLLNGDRAGLGTLLHGDATGRVAEVFARSMTRFTSPHAPSPRRCSRFFVSFSPFQPSFYVEVAAIGQFAIRQVSV